MICRSAPEPSRANRIQWPSSSRSHVSAQAVDPPQFRAGELRRRRPMIEQRVEEQHAGRQAVEVNAHGVLEEQMHPLEAGAIADELPLAVVRRADAELPHGGIPRLVGAREHERRRALQSEILVQPDEGARRVVDAALVERLVRGGQRMIDRRPERRHEEQPRAGRERSADDEADCEKHEAGQDGYPHAHRSVLRGQGAAVDAQTRCPLADTICRAKTPRVRPPDDQFVPRRAFRNRGRQASRACIRRRFRASSIECSNPRCRTGAYAVVCTYRHSAMLSLYPAGRVR
jgi:hypothetical protein